MFGSKTEVRKKGVELLCGANEKDNVRQNYSGAVRLQPQTKQQQNVETVVQMTELIKGENKAKKKKEKEKKRQN